jgi:hypothetical protein
MEHFFGSVRMMTLGSIVKNVLVGCALVATAGCATNDRIKPLPTTFLEDRDTTIKDDTLPLSHAWIDPEHPHGYYTKVYYRSVTVDRLPEDAWRGSMSTFLTSKAGYEKLAQSLADYFKQKLVEKTTKYKNGTFSVTDKAEEHGLVFDFAITELEFSHPVSKAGMLLVPVPGASVAFSAVSDPHVAFAARVYDGKTGRLLATLGDRRFPPIRLLDVNKVTLSSSAHEIVTDWADIIVEGLNRDEFAKVSDRGIFRLLPW